MTLIPWLPYSYQSDHTHTHTEKKAESNNPLTLSFIIFLWTYCWYWLPLLLLLLLLLVLLLPPPPSPLPPPSLLLSLPLPRQLSKEPIKNWICPSRQFQGWTARKSLSLFLSRFLFSYATKAKLGLLATRGPPGHFHVFSASWRRFYFWRRHPCGSLHWATEWAIAIGKKKQTHQTKQTEKKRKKRKKNSIHLPRWDLFCFWFDRKQWAANRSWRDRRQQPYTPSAWTIGRSAFPLVLT